MIFSKWLIFSDSLLFSGKTAFLQISADFGTEFEKLFFHLKTFQKRMQIDVKNFFVAGDISEKDKFQKQLDVYFCYSLYDGK